jgi:hypothetical protein
MDFAEAPVAALAAEGEGGGGFPGHGLTHSGFPRRPFRNAARLRE